VVAVTAYHSSDVARDVIRAGFDGYFAKPINPTTFVNQLSHIVAP
jgi:DNA-binding NarL/FixJ family response regulator